MGNLKEKKIRSENIFDGVLLNVKKDIVELPDGNKTVREYIVHPGAVVIVAFLPNGNIILERQFRYPVGKVFIELPAGKIDAGENLEDTAKREMAEETGYHPNSLQYIGKLYPGIGYSDEVIYIYKADRLEKRNLSSDDDEFIEIFDVPFKTAYQMVMSGEIVDAKSMIGIMMVKGKFDI
ncbi:MAG: NUDIX hydrolase [Candidatus Marinimicrobia bacterium]|nr:NUDIX hydrolase [Candidatus Neomarinimicrobiota bacterium]